MSTALSEVDFASDLQGIMDVDAHEMMPIHLWTQEYGERATEFARLAQGLQWFDVGEGYRESNNTRRPDINEDSSPITESGVWNIRGPEAPSAIDLRRRTEVMDLMGVSRQLVFPGFALMGMILAYNPDAHLFFGYDPAEVDRMAMARDIIDAHNDWCIRHARELGTDRVRPVAMVLTESMPQMMRDAEHVLESGVRAVQISNGTPPAGLSPANTELDPFWRLFAEANVPVTFHIGTEFALFSSRMWDQGVAVFEPSGMSTIEFPIQPHQGMNLNLAAENFLAAMVLGGVFERVPNLRFGAIELGAQWLGPFAERLDMWGAEFASRLSSVLSLRPSEYLNRNLRVTPFQFEQVASYFERYPHLSSSYCYATDYPHVEGGRNTKHKLLDALQGRVSDEIIDGFFRTNGLWLLPE